MDIKIGQETITGITKIIYISPNGSDTNDGYSKSTPILTLTKARTLMRDNYAICFMKGTHDFTNQFIEQSDGSNMHFFSTRYGTELQFANNVVFYSEDPVNTIIKLILTKGTSGYGRKQFFAFNLTASSNTRLYNLNFYLQGSSMTSEYDGFFTGLIYNTIYFYNCLFRCNISNDLWIDGNRLWHSKVYFYNSCFISSHAFVGSEYIYIYNTLYNSAGLQNCTFNSSKAITGLSYSNTINEYVTRNNTEFTNNVGLFYSNYQEWNSALFLIRLLTNYVSSKGTFDSSNNTISTLKENDKLDSFNDILTMIKRIDDNYSLLKIE